MADLIENVSSIIFMLWVVTGHFKQCFGRGILIIGVVIAADQAEQVISIIAEFAVAAVAMVPNLVATVVTATDRKDQRNTDSSAY